MDKKRTILIINEKKHKLDVVVNESGSIPDGFMRLKGVFGVVDIMNENKRMYTRSEYQKHVDKIQKSINEGLLGELEHPSTMRVSYENATHKVESVSINESGEVVGSILVLDTPKGQIVQSIAKAGVPIRISSRGYGSVSESGIVMLEELVTYDIVSLPGFKQANLYPVTESVDFKDSKDNTLLFEAKMYNEDEVKSNVDYNSIHEYINKSVNKAITESEKRMQLRITESCLKTGEGISNWVNNEIVPNIKIGMNLDESNSFKQTIIDESLTQFAEKTAPVIESFIKSEQTNLIKSIAPVLENKFNESDVNLISKIAPVLEQFIKTEQTQLVSKIAPVIESFIKTENVDSLKVMGSVLEGFIKSGQKDLISKIAPVLEQFIQFESTELIKTIAPIIDKKFTNSKVNEGKVNEGKVNEDKVDEGKNLLRQIDEQIEIANDLAKKAEFKHINESVFDKSGKKHLVMIPESYKKMWLNSKDKVKANINKIAEAYTFENELQIEKFWDMIYERKLYVEESAPNIQKHEYDNVFKNLNKTMSILNS